MGRILFIVIVGLTVGCGSPYEIEASISRKYFAALDAARPTAPYVADFVRLFPNAKVTYRYFGSGRPGPGFVCHALLFERYELTMYLPVAFDRRNQSVTGYGSPTFHLLEVKAAHYQTRSINYDGQRVFGPDEWKKVVAANGDFDAIDYKLKKDQPVPELQQLIAEYPTQ